MKGRVGKVDEKLQFLVNQVVHTNEIVLKLLEAQNSNPNDNKKGEKDESLRNPQDDQTTEVQAQTAGPSNLNSEVVGKPPNSKRMSTQTQRHHEKKKQNLSAEEKKREREASMIKEQQNQEKELADLIARTKKII